MKYIFFLIISLAPFTANAQIACYSFDNGSIRDQVSQEEGFLTGGTNVPDRFGRANGAIHIACGAGAITIGRGQQLKPTVGTVMLWVKIPTECMIGQAPSQPVVTFLAANGTGYDASYSINYLYSFLGSRFTANAYKGHPNGLQNTTSYNTWYHVALSFSDTEAKLYVDGSLQGSSSKQITQYDTLSYAYIGYQPDSQNFGDVIVDEFRVYDSVLTQAEIAAIHSAPMGATCSVVGTENQTLGGSIKIFPNPTTGALQLVHQNGLALKSYSIADISGRMVVENGAFSSFGGAAGGYNTLHLDLPNGVYALFVMDAEGVVTRHKVVLIK